jgi:hypothetical protein
MKTLIVEQYLNEHNELVLVDENGNEHEAPLEPVHLGRWRAIAVWIIAFSTIAILMYTANRHRINDIQASRVYSCQKNYDGTAALAIRVFFPNPRDARAQGTVDRLHDAADELKKKCVAQTNANRRVKTDSTGDGK